MSQVQAIFPGTASIKHLEENIFSASLELSQIAFEKLSAVHHPPVSLRN